MKKSVVIILICTGVLTIAGFLYLGYNHNQFVALNSVMEEVQVKPYDENNILIRTATLDQMTDKIEQQLREFSQWYDENITLSQENKKEESNLLTSDIKEEEKVDKLKNLYLKDLKPKLEKSKEDVLNIIKEELDYSSSEQAKVDNIKKQVNNVEINNDLKKQLDNYILLDELKGEANKNKETAKNRIKQEEEAKKKAEEEAKKKAEEEKIAEESEKAEVEEADDESSVATTVSNGNYNRALAQDMFNDINAYRTSLGLTPYTYNTAKQACVDTEAKAYADTQNPHNWLCPTSNENASLASVNSDAVQIAMNFFITDPPHEAVLSGNYTSCAISIYAKDGMYYMIVDVFS